MDHLVGKTKMGCLAIAMLAVGLILMGRPAGADHADASTTGQVSELAFAALVHKVERMAVTIEQLQQHAPPPPIPGGSRVSVLAFGADPLGQSDSTKAIQAALDSFGGRGGIVDVPSGRFRCDAELVVPPSVTLIGTFRSTPTHAGPWDRGHGPPGNLTGSVLESYGGKGSANGTAFITLNSDSTLEGVVIFYPEQVRSGTPLEYPFAVAMRGQDPALLSTELHNPYQGIDASNNIRHNIKDIAGQPLLMGLFVDGVSDIGRVENIHFHATIFSFALTNWTMNHGTCFKFGRSDWEYVFNTFCWGWRIGYHFYESKSDAQGNGANGPAGACNGNFVGIGADMVAISVLVEATQPYGLLITNGEFTAFQPGRAGKVDVSNITDVPTTVLVTPGYTGGVAAPSNLPCNKFCGVKVSFVNCAFWGSNDVKANISTSYEHAVVDFKDSSFFDWDLHHNDSYAIVAEDSGSITVTGCEFRQDAPQVLIGPNVRRAVVTGNLYEGLQRIDVQGGERDEVVVANNAGADFKGKRQLQRAARIY